MTKDVSVSEAEIERLASLKVNSVMEWDDRTSPDGYEEYLLITPKELESVLFQFSEMLDEAALRSNLKEQPVAWIDRLLLAGMQKPSVSALTGRVYNAKVDDNHIPLFASPSSPVSREAVIEECARVAEAYRNRFGGSSLAGEQIAALARSLSPTDKGEVGNG